MPRKVREYGFAGLAGCVTQRKARATGTVVGVYHGGQSGMERDDDFPWITVCEEHNTLCTHATLALALSHASDPAGWCGECQGRNR